ncbi:MFS transporter [Tessaracoccus sp. HDW20]|uniref:MFS transporter n=1 Tax=Tessaracoccus coleopterorum TaxID=2714950 RepID=UPI0018D498B9|nr:MFS transporter [Tessaracoccus coleopterorum]
MPTARYAALQSSYWSGFCLIVSFASVYLLGEGMSNAQIGLVIAVASAFATVLQPLVAGVAERSKWPLRLWIVAGGVLTAALGATLLLPSGRGLLLAINYGLLIGAIQIVQPLVNSIGMELLNRGFRLNFGLARAFASFTFALLSLAVGRVVEATSHRALPVLLIGVQLVFVVVAATFLFRRTPASGDRGAAVVAAPEPRPLDRAAWTRFSLLLVGFTLAMTSHNLISGFMYQIATSHGGGAGDMGIAVMIGALAELPTMIGFNLLARRWTPGVLMTVAGAAFALKSLATLLAPTWPACTAPRCCRSSRSGSSRRHRCTTSTGTSHPISG